MGMPQIEREELGRLSRSRTSGTSQERRTGDGGEIRAWAGPGWASRATAADGGGGAKWRRGRGWLQKFRSGGRCPAAERLGEGLGVGLD